MKLMMSLEVNNYEMHFSLDLGILTNDRIIKVFNEELKTYPGKALDFK